MRLGDLNLQDLIDGRRLWRGREARAAVVSGLPMHHPALEACCPGGWPDAALTELLVEGSGLAGLQLVMPALARASLGDRWVAWVAPPHVPYAPALLRWGVDVSRVLVIHDRPGRDRLWALEQALRSGTCAAVLGWVPQAGHAVLRRLQLAAEHGRCWGIVFRPPHVGQEASPAALRLAVQPEPGGLAVQVLKRRGGWPSTRVHVPLVDPAPVDVAPGSTAERAAAAGEGRRMTPARNRGSGARPGRGVRRSGVDAAPRGGTAPRPPTAVACVPGSST